MRGREAISAIARDIGVERWKGESGASFSIRTAYSASRFMIESFCIDDAANGSAGISKQALNAKLKKWLRSIEPAVPEAKDWFLIDEGGMSLAYKRLIDLGDLLSVGFTDRFAARGETNLQPNASTKLKVGFYDMTKPSPFNVSGLTSLASEAGAGSLERAPWWEEDLGYLNWSSSSCYGPLEYANAKTSRWGLRKSDSWTADPFFSNGLSLARKTPTPNQPISYYVVQKTRSSFKAAEVDYSKAQELFFYIKKSFGNPVRSYVWPLDEKHLGVFAPLGLLAPSERRFTSAIYWPEESIIDGARGSMRTEGLQLLKDTLAQNHCKLTYQKEAPR